MINGIDVESYLISHYQNDEYYRTFNELSRSKPDNPSTNMVKCDKKAYSFDRLADLFLGESCSYKLCSADALYVERNCQGENLLYIIEFKTGFKDKISKENFDENLMKCDKLDPPVVCMEYKDLFFEKREKEKDLLKASLHEKAVESYVLLCHSLFPQCTESQKQYRLVFIAVIDDVKDAPIEAIERVFDGITDSESSDNLVTNSQISLKKYMVKDASGIPVMYDKACVWSVEDFYENICPI